MLTLDYPFVKFLALNNRDSDEILFGAFWLDESDKLFYFVSTYFLPI